ncbi:MAG: hypothetical protein ACO4AC_10815, partial [Pseudohongiellaceae bacterium]
MKRNIKIVHLLLAVAFTHIASVAKAADKELLDILLQNNVITEAQYNSLLEQESISSEDILGQPRAVLEENSVETLVAEEVSEQLERDFPVTASRSNSGFRLETRDGNWQTNLQWRAQMRFTSPLSSDPRQLSSFNAEDQTNFEARRLRMKIGGHGLQPWIQYYFEVDLQPSRDVDDSSASSSPRVIDYRIDLAKWDWGGIRIGQWKVDL